MKNNFRNKLGRFVKGHPYGKRFKKGYPKLPNAYKFLKGHSGYMIAHSEEAKEKISIAMKGRKLTEEWKKKIGDANKIALKGKKQSLETIEKRRKKISGKNNWNWQGGKSFEEYGKEFKPLRETIRQRDNHKCQLCGCLQIECITKLDVHHIDYNKKNSNIKNLISLCLYCHRKTNYNRKSWTRLFRQKMEKKYAFKT